jgi:malonate-semialdehyde dehydrogenase (acetylating)/methylmalonate-semialdehyde dehydrogenase
MTTVVPERAAGTESAPVRRLANYIEGRWVTPETSEWGMVINPSTGERLAEVPYSTAAAVDEAVRAAKSAFPAWRKRPPLERARYLFKVRNILEEHFEELATILTDEAGKSLPDSRLEVRRGLEMVEVATGMPSLMMGQNLEDVSRDIDSQMIRQPIGVFAAITPYNFPSMVPLWFLPFAVACGNTFIVKPSEQVPLSQIRMFELLDQAGFPPGVINMVNGSRDVVNALLDHKDIKGISFVGSATTAKYVYARASERGKRVQALGGAKNHMVVMPDAAMEKTLEALMGSAFGAAGQRCLAASVVVAVGDVYEPLRDGLVAAAKALKVGDGRSETTDVGPVISRKHQKNVHGWIEKGVAEGAKLILDGRAHPAVAKNPEGCFIGPTIFDEVTQDMSIATEEIFGPVLSIVRARNFDEAIEIVNSSRYGNASAIFTRSGKAAREYKYRVQAGMVGVNIGVAAPMAFFSFTGWKDSFFGDMHAHGRDGVEFFTEKKTVIERWFD